MDRFWKAAISVGGIGAVGAFVFWSLYRDWLTLPIFSQLSSKQTFILMLVFLTLTFAALGALSAIHGYSKYLESRSQREKELRSDVHLVSASLDTHSRKYEESADMGSTSINPITPLE